MRVGTGYDSHRFSASRPLVLGGIDIPDSPGLSGHSDGDAVLHALTDALLGAASLGSIGERFPDDDSRYSGVDSALLLAETMAFLSESGYHVVNADITVIAERPRIQTHARAMENRIAELLGIGDRDVCVKGKTNEGMGWIGRQEGIAVIAAVLIDRHQELDAPDASSRNR